MQFLVQSNDLDKKVKGLIHSNQVKVKSSGFKISLINAALKRASF